MSAATPEPVTNHAAEDSSHPVIVTTEESEPINTEAAVPATSSPPVTEAEFQETQLKNTTTDPPSIHPTSTVTYGVAVADPRLLETESKTDSEPASETAVISQVIEPTPTEDKVLPVMTETEPTHVAPEATQPAVNPTTPLVSETPSTAHAEDAEESQNDLTRKFTDVEWKALKGLRSQLSDVFAEAYPEQPKARDTPVNLWGVTLDPVDPKSDARVSVILMKFLRARHLSVRDARAMLVNTLRWREEFGIKAIMQEEFPKDIFSNLGYLHGRDKEGRPIVYNIYGGNQDLKAAFGDVQRFIRWRVALMEKSVALLDFDKVDQMIQIHDYAGVKITSRSANSKAAASEASNIFQSHYPELLYRKFFINVPTFLTWIFWAFQSMVSSETFAKMSVVGQGKSTVFRALHPYIDDKEIPVRYGGEAQAL